MFSVPSIQVNHFNIREGSLEQRQGRRGWNEIIHKTFCRQEEKDDTLKGHALYEPKPRPLLVGVVRFNHALKHKFQNYEHSTKEKVKIIIIVTMRDLYVVILCSWHVLSRDNLERVRQDEAEAKRQEEEKAKRAALAVR